MMQAGADINVPRYDGNTPLHLASARNLLGAAALLVAAGADPEAENSEPAIETEMDMEGEDDRDEDTAADTTETGQTPYDMACSEKVNIIQGNLMTMTTHGTRFSGLFSEGGPNLRIVWRGGSYKVLFLPKIWK